MDRIRNLRGENNMEEITAAEARKLSQKLSATPRQELLEKIFVRIKDEADKGQTEVSIAGGRDDVVIRHIESLGYQIDHHVCRSGDPRESDYYTVSW